MGKIKFADLVPQNSAHMLALDQAFRRVIVSGQYIGGQEILNFEREWADYVGARFCVGVSSGFSALSLAIRALAPAEVAIPANTCRPTFAAAFNAGLANWQINPIYPNCWPVLTEEWDDSPSAQMLIRVLLHGYISDLEHYDHPNSLIIDDACQAHGRQYKELDRQKECHAAAWSFYPTKNLGAYGDAGAITTNILGLAEQLREMRDYRGSAGENARLDPLQAAFLRENMRYLEDWNIQREQQAAYYSRRFRDANFGRRNFSPILPPVSRETNWHHYILRCMNGERDRLKAFLAQRQIETAIHYEEPGSSYIGEFPLAAVEESRSVLSLPLGPHLMPDDAARVVEAICLFYRRKNEEIITP